MMVNYNVRKIGKIGIPLFFFFLLFIAGVVDVAAASTIVVSKTSPACSSGNEYYTSIQAAVDNAKDGYEIVVCPGTYVENIEVDKRLSIRSENGPDSTIVQAKKTDKDAFEVTADYVDISGFTVNGAKGWLASGIHLHYADYCNISNNNCSNNNNGIYAQYSSNNIITDNSYYNNTKGILLLYSNNNRISNNICTNNGHDIFLRDSKNNKLIGNDMVENGILIEGDTLSDYTHEIDESNTVNGKPVYYWKDREGGKVPGDAGQCILVNCSHIDVKNQDLSNATVGMEVVYSSHIAIFNNTCSNNREAGIMLMNSRNTTIEKNIVSNNGFGIYLNSSFNNIIKDNTILNNGFGIYLAYYSFNNTLGHNVAKSNYRCGIGLYSSSDHNTIEDNIASNNGDGITVSESGNNIIKNNTACENEISGINLWDSSGNDVCTNIANKNLLYGFLLAGSSNNKIRNNTACENTFWGIELSSSNNCTVSNNIVTNNFFGGLKSHSSCNNIVKDNIISDNRCGILLYSYSFNNTIKNNIVKSNYYGGIELESSSGYNTIEGNIASNNGNGIDLYKSECNFIKNNTINSNDYNGIELEHSIHNNIGNNTANSNGEVGIRLFSNSSHNTVEGNTVNSNADYGIELYTSDHNIISDNTANLNKKGICILGSSYLDVNFGFISETSNNNHIEGNVVLDNRIGIFLDHSSNNTIKNNIASNNNDGISLYDSFNNTIKSNIALNNRIGISIDYSENINIENNIISNNHGTTQSGIYLRKSKENTLKNNIVKSNNGTGISLFNTWYTIFENNNISSNNFLGIYLCSYSSNNELYHNNIIDNNIQATKDSLINYWYHPLLLEGNYWSDYNGTDDGSGSVKHAVRGDGIGDTNIPHLDIDYDNYPFMNKSGWLTFVVSPEYWDFGTVYQGELVQKTFKIQNAFVHNKCRDDLNILPITSDQDVDISDIVLPLKILKGTSKTFNVTIDTANMQGHILRNIEIQSDDVITPNKTILIYGFVKPPIHDVRIKNIDFQSRIIKGQISLFNITIENLGDFREKNLTVEIKEGGRIQDSTTIEHIDSKESKSAIVKWNTEKASLGIHDIIIEVSNKDKEPFTDISVRTSVLAPSKAKTLIVTNLERLDEVENDLIPLSHHPSVNGIILNVGNDPSCLEAYNLWDSNRTSENANDVAKAIKDLIDSSLEVYKNIEYIIIVGNDEVIPFYRIPDKSLESYVGSYGLYDEKDYIERYDQLKPATTIGSAFQDNMYLTDDFYANFESEDLPEGFDGELYIPDIPVGRLVETPEEISKTIDVFSKRGDLVEPNRIFITSYDFMNDAGGSCASVWSTLSTPVFMGKGIEEHGTYSDTSEIINELLNESNNIVAIFQHADHYEFDIAESHDFVTSNIISNSSADLDGSIVYTMSCHAGLNVPDDEKFNYDLAQAFMGKGVLAYVAPTGWGIGGVVTEAGHERLLHYFTKHLCEGMDAGTALMHAKQDYYAFDFDFDYIDQKVVLTTVLYGLPMYSVNVEAKTEGLMKAMSREKPCNTFTFRPDYSEIETPVGAYSTVDETLSSPGKPVLPKLIWPYIMDGKMLHGITLKNARYALLENTALPYEEYVVSIAGGYKQPLLTGETWNPSEFFKVSSIGKRQYIILITGQFKKTGWTIKGGQKVNIGDLRRYSELTFDLHLSAPADEKNPPAITVSYVNASCITVNATDESGIEKLVMAYTDNTGNWESFDLEPDVAACTLEEEIELEAGKEYLVQVVDIYGNVAVDDNDGEYYLEKGGSPGR